MSFGFMASELCGPAPQACASAHSSAATAPASPDALVPAAVVPGEVTADPSAEPVPTAGTAALQVVVRAPAVGYGTSGHQPWRVPDQVNDPYYTAEQLQGWGSLREVRFAGSFEGITTVAVGVEAELPFRVGSYEQDGISHVYLDIAHPRPGS